MKQKIFKEIWIFENFISLKKGNYFVKITVTFMELSMWCFLMILNTNINFHNNIYNSSRDIEGNVNFGNCLSLKRGITLGNRYGVTTFLGAHNICAGDYFYQVWHQYLIRCRRSRPDKIGRTDGQSLAIIRPVLKKRAYKNRIENIVTKSRKWERYDYWHPMQQRTLKTLWKKL